MIQKVLLPYLHDEPIPGAKASAFWCFYTLEEMGQRGFGPEVISFIRKHWEPMLITGTTWEEFHSINSPGSSNCHAWTSHPSVHFATILAGIRQTAPAWKSITFSPIFVRNIDHAQAKVPTPQGMIEASWQREGDAIHGTLKLPRGTKARIAVPGRKPTTQTGGTYRF